LFATVPLAFRRRWPLAVLCAVMGAIALDSIVVGKAPQGLEVLLPALVAVYSVAAHAELRRALVGFVVGFAGTVIEAALDPEVVTFGDLVVVEGTFFVGLGGGAWLVGRYVRARRLEAERSAHRADRIEREQHELARAAVAAERGRIARELHDVIAHSVSLMGVQAGAVERVLERDPDTARKSLRSIQATARESVGELRRLLGILRTDEAPPGLAPQPGLNALASLLEESRRAGLPAELEIEGEPRALPPGVELSAYRVAQEALTNARKHAPGAPARVVVRYRPDELEVYVRNAAGPARNGADDAAGGSGHGLLGMRERVALYGGSLEARTASDGGFEVRARLPVEVTP
jgi:signal transduction histidine kinase